MSDESKTTVPGPQQPQPPRRLFIFRAAAVLGAAAAGALSVSRAKAQRTGESNTDSDFGPNADPVGSPRNAAPKGSPSALGITDSDSGPDGDPAGRGRGSRSTPAGPETGVTDSDAGPGADPRGHGRGGKK